jgi:hypothetical protein
VVGSVRRAVVARQENSHPVARQGVPRHPKYLRVYSRPRRVVRGATKFFKKPERTCD